MKHLYALMLACLIGVSGLQAQYCTPVYSIGTTSGDSLSSFQLANLIGNYPGNPAGYNNYTTLDTANLLQGQTYNITLVNNPTWSSGVSVWIDYNQNFVFETSEFVGDTLFAGGTTVTLPFTVPITALPGVTRLRMVQRFATKATDPCGTNFSFGETEDYSVFFPSNSTDDMASLGFVNFNLEDCGIFTTGIPLTMGYANLGSNPADTVIIGYIVNGGTPVTDTLYNIAATSSGNFVFAQPVVLPLPTSFYTIQTFVSYNGDLNVSNDTQTATILTPIVAALPLTEDFETFTSGTPGTLNNGWTSANSNNLKGWRVSNAATPTTLTGPNEDHTVNGSTFMFIETSSGVNNEAFSLYTPCVDLAGSPTPRLSFWYHMAGATTGSLQVHVIAGGVTTQVFNLTGAQQLNEADPWLQAFVDLTAYAGQTVKIEFRGIRGNGGTGDIGLDDVQLFTPAPLDAGAILVVSPTQPGCYGAAEPVTVRIQNFGTQPLDLTATPVTVKITSNGPLGSTLVTGPAPGGITLAPLGTLDVVVPGVNLATSGIYDFDVATSVTGDPNVFNDSTFGTVESLPVFPIPFNENFESFISGAPGSLSNGWFRSNTTNLKGWHVSAGTTPTTNTGPAVDHTSNGTNYVFIESTSGVNGENFQLTSPCINLAGATSPKLQFWYHMFGLTTGTLQAGVVVNGVYTQLFSLTGQQQTTEAAPWLSTEVDLSSFAGQTVQVRFTGIRGNGGTGDISVDDVRVYEPSPFDVKASTITAPTSDCALGTAEPVTVDIINFGTAALTNIVAKFSVDGGPFGAFVPVPGTLPIGDTISFTFPPSATANLSAPGAHAIRVVATQLTPADADPSNDTSLVQLTNFGTPISTFPWVEDFETFTAGNPGVLSNGWTRNSVNLQGWYVSAGPTSSSPTGPNADNTPTGTKFVFVEASGGALGDVQNLISPCIDLGGLGAPKLEFFYHMNGVDMGTLQAGVLIGNTFTSLWSLSGQQQPLESSPWGMATVDLTAYAGQVVRVVFRGIRGNGFLSDMAVDDARIYDPVNFDVNAAAVLAPVSGCALTNAEPVTVRIINFGAQNLTNIVAKYAVDGGAYTALENVPGTLPPGDTVVYTFSALANLSGLGSHTIEVVATQLTPLDTNPANDTAATTAVNFGNITTYPYQESFENGAAGWLSGGAINSWALGTPAKTVIQGAADGINAWTTGGLTGTHPASENSFVVGPCFDFSTLVIPVIELDIWWQSEFSWDGAVLQSSINGGATWQNVGALNDPNNWYNDNTINGNPGGQQTGWSGRLSTNNGSGGWVPAKHLLNGLGGQPSVRLRIAFGADGSVQDEGFAFDNIRIYDLPNQDAGLAALVAPEDDCGLTGSSVVTVTISNTGAQPITNIPVSFQVNGGTVVTETAPITIQPGATGNYTFTATANLAAEGSYFFNVWTSLLNDGLLINDTLIGIEVVHRVTVDTYPYMEDFENGAASWSTGGTLNSWALGTPAKATIQGASSGVNAWVTGGLGTNLYNNNEQSFVLGPCFDFTGIANPVIQLDVWWETEFSNDGAVLQTSIDNGATWQTVGALGDPYNWYTDNTINGNPGGQQVGWSGRINTNNGSNGWRTARHALTGVGNQASALVRIAFGATAATNDDGFAFDNVIVYNQQAQDFGVIDFADLDFTGCSSDTIPVTVSIFNYGSAPQSNIPVTVNIGGAGTATINGTFPGPLNPGDTATFIVGTYVYPDSGAFTFTGLTTFVGDTTTFNNSFATVANIDLTFGAPVVISDSVCATDSASFTLIAISDAPAVYWYDAPTGGNVVFVGDTFNTPFLQTTTTYYAEPTNSFSYNGFTPPNNTIGTGSNYTFLSDGLEFSVFQALTLKSVKVYPFTAGNIVVNLIDANGAVVQTSTFPFGGSVPDTTITLNWDIQPGDYSIDAAGSTTGGFYRNTSGSVFPYQIPGIISITNTINNLAGFYYFFYNWDVVTIGCTGPRTPVSATILAPIDVDLGPDGVQCSGFQLDATGPGIVSWQWNGDPSINTPTLTAATTGLYFVEVTNAVGCTGTDSVLLIINPSPTVALGSDTASCNAVILDAGNAGASFSWSTGANTQTIAATQSGSYAVTVTSLGCVTTDTIDVTIHPTPVVELGPAQTTCQPVTLDAGNTGATYLWSTGATSQNVTIPAPASGQATNVSVTVTNSFGCVSSDNLVITGGTPPVVSLGADLTACDSTQLNAGVSNASYLWSSGETTQSIWVDASGTYSVVVTDAQGCQGTDDITVTIKTLPVADFTYAQAVGGTLTFTNTSTPLVGVSVAWDFGDGNTSTALNPTNVYAFPGTYDVTLTVTNECGSTSKTIRVITFGVSVDDELFARMIQVYPNPTEGEIEISGTELKAERLTIEVYDPRGRVVYNETLGRTYGSFSHKADLSHYAEGVYLIKVSDGERTAYIRVMHK